MSRSTISIPSDSTGESVRSLASLVILSDTEAKVMAVPTVLPKISPEAKAAVVASPTAILDLVIESDPEVEPSEALLSPDYIPAAPVHAPTSRDYHTGSDTESEPFEDESEEPFEDDAPEAAEPLPAQVPTASISSTTTRCTIASQEVVTQIPQLRLSYQSSSFPRLQPQSPPLDFVGW
ncbi:hypothetical protein Tco_1153789 [Tanacetum coccineum]